MYKITRSIDLSNLRPTNIYQWRDTDRERFIIVMTHVPTDQGNETLSITIDRIGFYWIRISSDGEEEDTSISADHTTFSDDVVTKTCVNSAKIWIVSPDMGFSMYYTWTREEGLVRVY